MSVACGARISGVGLEEDGERFCEERTPFLRRETR